MKSNRLITGVLFVIVGVVLLLNNLGYLPGFIPDYLFSWTSIFLLIAIVNLASGNRKGSFIFFILWGFFFISNHTYINIWDYWPLILIAIGLTFLINNKATASSEIGDNYFDDMNIFGGSDKKFTSDQLEGGKITTIFGGSTIDLRESTPIAGARIEVFTMFGGCNIIVPKEWNVSISVTSIFGGFEDKRDLVNQRNGTNVTIKGLALFGGGELKSAK